jgi:hypothetical protein
MRKLASLALWMSLVVGCSGVSVGADSGAGGSDSGPMGDSGSIVGHDAGPGSDAGPGAPDTGADAGHLPEVCSGGVDEDGDLQIDCADSDCWSDAACMLADVTHVVPGATPCGDPIVIDTTASAMACASIGMPMGSTYVTDCTSGRETATGHVYCDASGAPVALWLEEQITTPRSQEMLSARMFRIVSWERESVVDWERQVSGASSREGATGFPIHEGWAPTSGSDRDGFRVITVRSVHAGDGISRLLGMTQITSLIDLDMPMSMDTRDTRHLGGLMLTIPTP